MALPLIVGGAIAAGTGIANYIGQSSANSANRDIAYATNAQNLAMYVNNQQWQTQMSNSAYQRSTADLRAAGLNPILAAQNGGASTPTGGGPAAVTGAPMQNEMSGVGDAVRVGKELKAMDQMVKTQQSQEDLNKDSATNLVADRFIKREQLKVVREQLKQLKSETGAVSAEAALRQTRAIIDKKMAIPDATIDRVGRATGAVGNIIGGGKLIQSISNSAKQNRRHQRQSDMQYERHLHRQGMKGSSVR